MPEKVDKFENWTSFLDHLEHGTSEMPMDKRSSHDEGRREWSGVGSYPEALELARGGWKEGVAQVLKLSAAIENRLYNIVQYADISCDVTGELLDVGRFVSGEPEHWGNWEYTLREGLGTKHIHIVVNVVASWGIDAEVLITRGSAIAALINLLELAGHRVKLDMTCAIGKAGYLYETYVNVKQFEETLDIDRVTYAVAHPSVLRRHFFNACEFLPEVYRSHLSIYSGGGYGRCVGTTREWGDIYMPMMELGADEWSSPEKATKWVNAKLIEMGVLAKELEETKAGY